jgi:hypothetical protein
MGLDVTVSVIIVGLSKYHDSEEKFVNVEINYDILPEGLTLPYGFRHCFNHYTSKHASVVGDFISDDSLTEDQDFAALGLNLEEASKVVKRIDQLDSVGVASRGIVTFDDWLKIAEEERVNEGGCYKALIEAYADSYGHIENKKVLIYVENDQWY